MGAQPLQRHPRPAAPADRHDRLLPAAASRRAQEVGHAHRRLLVLPRHARAGARHAQPRHLLRGRRGAGALPVRADRGRLAVAGHAVTVTQTSDHAAWSHAPPARAGRSTSRCRAPSRPSSRSSCGCPGGWTAPPRSASTARPSRCPPAAPASRHCTAPGTTIRVRLELPKTLTAVPAPGRTADRRLHGRPGRAGRPCGRRAHPGRRPRTAHGTAHARQRARVDLLAAQLSHPRPGARTSASSRCTKCTTSAIRSIFRCLNLDADRIPTKNATPSRVAIFDPWGYSGAELMPWRACAHKRSTDASTPSGRSPVRSLSEH